MVEFLKIAVAIMLIIFIWRIPKEYFRRDLLDPRKWYANRGTPSRRTLLNLGVACLAIAAMYYLLPFANQVATEVTGAPTADPDDNMVVNLWSVSPYLLLAVAVVMPVLEELLFREMALKYFRAKRGVIVGVLASSLMFASLHLLNEGYNPGSMLPPFVAGLLLGVTYVIGGLRWSIAAHVGNNVLIWLIIMS